MDIHILRNLVMRYGAELNLSSVEKECIWHLLDHDHNGKGYSYPSEATIAKRMHISERYVRDIILRLEKRKDLITVKRVAGSSNQYRYHGIMKAMHVFLDRENGRGKKRVQKSEDQLSLIEESAKPPRNPSSAPTQEPQFRPPRNPSSGVHRNHSSAHPGTPVPSNTAKNSANRTLQDNTREKSAIPPRYQQEFEHWKVEQGNRIFQIEFDEPPLWTLADAKEFARLRSDGKRLEEITDRYEQYIRTNNAWYAKNGYSFSVFVKNYASFNSRILARQAETKGNGRNEESTGDRTLDVYMSAMRGAKLADEMMREANAQ
ncbi:MAG: helix-turn-helix domain-containing protein [Phycisphaeraceae bacterium]|nr:helix-turn-helix domain-containing protein [Phycisphaeraceae bacterium]